MARSHDFIQIFSHHDSDGLSSAGILANALARENKEFQVTILPIMNEENVEKVRNCDAECVIVSDLGAYYVQEFEKIEGKDIICLDHHTLNGDAEKIVYANPHLFGVDGMTSACGATMCFLFAIQLNEKNWDLSQIAFAGITGDRQTINGVSGFNKYVLDGAVEKGFIEIVEGSIIPSGRLTQSLYQCTEPYIRGISGNVSGVKKILEDANIDSEKTSDKLTDEEKRKLSSLLVTTLAGTDVTIASMKEYVKTKYFLKDWNIDSDTLANLLDSCGRLESPSIAVALCLGSQDDRLRATEFNNKSNEDIMQSVLELDKKKPTQMNNIQYFYADERGSVSAICSIAMKCLGDPAKPMIGLHKKEKFTRVSSRGTFEQLDKGVNLADALHRAAESVNGEGGGHKIASGATIDLGTEETFLKNLDDIIGKQISARSR